MRALPPLARGRSARRQAARAAAALLALFAAQASGEGIAGSPKKIFRSSEIASGESRGPARRLAKARRSSAPGVAGDARTLGLGRSCRANSDCAGRTQVCLKEQDANGKELKAGICALPCAAIDAGMPDPLEAPPDPPPGPKKPPPPRCPKKFQCRSAGAGVPIDLCTKE